jgi:hypothetical protein
MKNKLTTRLLLGAALAATATPALADTEAQTVLATAHVLNSFGVGETVSFFDISDVTGGTSFDQALFHVWTGYELTATPPPAPVSNNWEDISGLAFNPINGTMYLAAFDSGPLGVADVQGDTQGDYDLYRVDYQELLKDFNENGRAAGTVYAPTLSANGLVVNPVHPASGTTTVNIADAFEKIGEIGRSQSGGFFDIDLEFINPGALTLIDNMDTTISNSPGTGDITVDRDHTLRLWERVSTAAGAASGLVGTSEGGYNNQTTESWESVVLAELNMDLSSNSDVGISLTDTDESGGPDSFGTTNSNMHGIALVRNQNGTLGVWVAENDGPDPNDPTTDFNDEFSFFEIDLAGKSATKKEFQVGTAPYADSFRLDEDPIADPTSNDGDADHYFVDPDGNLLILENGFFEGEEPKVIKREVLDYDAADTDANTFNEIQFGAWATTGPIVPTSDDDPTEVTDSVFATYDAGENHIYIFDVIGESGFGKDVYVIDAATGALVYEELDASGIQDIFFERHTTRVFTRGDATGDGQVTAEDIDAFFAVSNTGDALMQEMYTLNDDTVTDLDDVTELVEVILGTFFGDANLSGGVDFADFSILSSGFNQAGGWADGDFNGDGVVSFADFSILSANFGENALSAAEADFVEAFAEAAVPEPTSLALLGIGGLLLTRRRR